MPKLYPFVALLLLGVFAAGNPHATAQCSNFTFTTTVTNVKCYNGTTGSIVVTVTGTDGPYQYQLSQANAGGWSGVNTFTGLIAGSYPVSVKGASGCISTSYVTISQPSPISVNYKETDPVCANTNTGTIQQTTTISGGTAPYSYNWTLGGSAFSTAANLTNLAPGNYQVVVNDANGCQAAPNIVEGSSTPITAAGFNSDIVANGANISPDAVANDGVDACPGGYVFYAQGYSDTAAVVGTAGLPASGSFTSVNTPTNSYQLASYSANNALVLFSTAGCNATTSGTLTLQGASVASYGTIYVLGTSGSGSGTVNYQVNYTDASTPTTGSLTFLDWATTSSQSAIAGLGRISFQKDGVYDGNIEFNLYEEPITIPPANATKKVQSITFTYNTTGTGRVNIVALTGLAANPGLATVNVGTGSSAPASVSIVDDANAGKFCSGQTVNFTATPTNGGATPTYQWQLNGANISGATSATYADAAPTANKPYTVLMTSALTCATPTTSTSNSITLTTGTVKPKVTVAASTTTICSGTAVTFTPTVTNGGGAPTYQWDVNGASTGVTTPTYTSSTLNNNDNVAVIVTSNISCATSNPVTSANTTMTVTSVAAPTVSIAASATSIQTGTTVNFTSSITNGGTTPVYQWYRNGSAISGATSSTYSTSAITNGDVFSVTLSSSASCVSSPFVFSNYIAIAVTVPTPAAPVLVAGGSATNNNQAPLKGTALALSTVTLYVDGVAIGTTTADASGNYTFTPTIAIPDGTHSVTAVASDAGGNSSSPSPVFTLTVDTTPPVAPTIALASGSSPTNNNKPPFTGTAEAGSTVTIYVDGTSIGTTTANASGNYTFTPSSAIPDGIHSITATATDAVGNVSAPSSPLSLTIDTVPPSAPTIGLASGSSPTNNNKPAFAGTAEANSTVTIYVDGVAIGTTTADASGNYTFTPTSAIADGTHSITATATDAAGNIGVPSSPLSLTIDTVAPSAPTIILASGSNPTNNNKPPFSGTAEANSTVTIYVDGVSIGTTTADASGNYTFTPTSTIADGIHSITATATDAAGNVSVPSSPLSLTIDTVAPSAPTIGLASGSSPTNNNKPPFAGTAETNSTVTIYVDGVAIGTTTANASGSYIFTPSSAIADGTHSITATATDAAGNVSPLSAPLSLTIDTVAPSAPTIGLASGSSPANNNKPPFVGTAEANSTVTIYLDGVSIGTTTANASGNYTFTPTNAIADGTHSITATATDAAGNVSPSSSPLSLTIDTVAPSAPTIGLASGSSPTNNNKPPFAGTAEANSTVIIYVDGVAIGTTTTDAAGNWTYTPTSTIADGTHAITATATDAAGNVSPASSPLSLTIITVIPSAPTIALASGSSPTNNNKPPFAGTAEANSTVTIYVDGVAIGTTTANAAGNYTFTPTSAIADGTHAITATATDAAGNVSPTSSPLSLTIDTTPPTAPTIGLASGSSPTNNNRPPFAGTAEANSTVTIYVDGTAIGTTITDAAGNWTYTPASTIADGTHSITATATDAAGNVSPASSPLSLTIDTIAPSAPTISLASGSSPTNNNKPPFAGTAEANSTVTIYVDGVAIGITTANASGNYTFTPTTAIADGIHSITATATDAAGNVSPASSPLSLTIITVAPSAPTIGLASGSSPTNNNKPPFTGTAEVGSTVTIYVDGVSIGTTTADASGNYTFTPSSAIADGTHSITATAMDAAGNVSPASTPLSLTIDTTPPTAPTIALASGSNPTNNNKPPFAGTAEANSTVTVYVDGVSIGTTIANASGNWTYTPTSTIADGTHAITATATDAAGNVSPTSSPLSLTIDTTPPTAPTIALASGSSPTNNNKPPFAGTAEANSIVTIYVDGAQIGTTTADAAGKWTYTPTSTIADGTHSITATATDAAGNVSPTSSPLSLTIDATAPNAPTVQLASGNNPTNNNEPPLKGTAEPNSTVTIYVDGAQIGTTTADAAGNWTFTPTSTIADGTHAITATATDAAGNVSPASAPLSLTIDTTAPNAPTVQLASGSNPTNNNEPPLKGTAEPNSTVTIYVDGTAIGTTTADAAGKWTFTPTSTIADGTHAITATATDAAGNVSPASSPLSLTIDTTPPTAPTIGLASGSSPTNNNKPPFAGTAEANSTVTIYVDGTVIGTATADAAGNWTYTPTSTIADGNHAITATATDAAGNVSPASTPLSLTIDTTPPTAPTITLASGSSPTNNNEPPLKGTAEPNSTVTIYVDGAQIGTTTANAAGNWTFTPTNTIADGTHSITATATDAAGNVSPTSSPLSLTIDTTAPNAPTIQLASGSNPTNNNEPPLKGTAEPNSTVTIYVDGAQIGTTNADAAGNWTYTPTSTIADGTHSITATATDVAGNVSPASSPLSLTIITVAPSAPTIGLASGSSPTNDNKPPFAGTAEANSTVTIYVDGIAIGTTTANATGNYTFTPTTAIADGTHSITATATDAAGNVSPTSSPLSLTIDTIAPNAPTIQLASGSNPTNNNEPPLKGTAEPNSTVTIYVDGTAIGTTTADAAGNWTYTPTSTIADGTHSITATATDAAGNISPASSPLSLTIDTTPPTAPTIALASGSNPTNNNEPPLKGTAEPNSTVTIYVDGAQIGTTTANAAGNWTFTPTNTIADGTHSITATATDAAGNVSPTSSPLSLTIDTTAPNAPTVQLASGSNPTNNNEPPLKGTAEPNSTVTIYVDGTQIGTTTADAAGNWTFTPTSTIADGTHAITATATDAAGNVSPASSPLSLTIDTTPPTAPTIALASGSNPTNNNEPPLKGTAESNSTVTIYVDGTQIGTTTADAAGNWTFTPTSTIADGTHAITATATDAAGNVSPASSPLSLTIDTTPPTAPTIALASGSNPTNNNEPPLKGTAESNSTVTIYVDGTQIGTTTADAAGNWTFTPTSTIADGTHSITATATDAAGNVSPASSPLSLTIDTTPPTAPTIALASGSNPTNNNEPPLKGTAEPNSTVTIYVDGTQIGTTTADAAGNWTFTPTSAITDGTHAITATATDAAGNVSPTSAPLGLTIDTTAPTAPTVQLASGSNPTNNNEPPLKGTAEPNSTVTIYVDGTEEGTTTADAAGNWTFTPTSAITDGTHAITATATDAAGNASPASAPLGLTIDTTAPTAPTVQLASGSNPTNNNEPPLKGTAEPNSTVTIYVDGTEEGTTTADAAGNWTFTPTTPIADGTHNITATATDAAGNVSPTSAPLSLTIDTIAPNAPTIQLASGSNPTNNNEPPLKGTAEPNSIVTIYVDGTEEGTTTADAAGNWTFTPTTPMADGTHNITATATDAAGNVSPTSAPLSLTIDTTAPNAPTIQLASGTNPTNNNEPPLKGTAEPNSTVTIYVDGTQVGTTTADAAGNWTFTPTTPIADGTHNITATATDAAGNVSPTSAPLSLTIDTTAPNAPTIQLASGSNPTNNNEPPLKGTAEPNSTVTIYVDGTQVGTTTADASGNWTFTPTTPIANGTHNITATATDAAGNVSPTSDPLSLTINTSAPSAPTVQLASGKNPDNNNEPPLKGTADPNSTVTIYVDGVAIGTTTADASGNWTFTPTTPIADGTHSITATATDAAGTVSPVSPALSLNIDTTPPATPPAPVLIGGNDGNINTTTPTITGTAEPGSTVTIYVGGVPVGTTTAGADGNYTYTFNPALSQGSQTVTVSATDSAGNMSGQSPATKIVVNTTPPGVTLTTSVQQTSQPFTVTITFSEPVIGFDTSFIALSNATLSDLTEVSPGVYTIVVTPQTAGNITMSVDKGAAMDSAGNTSLASNVLAVDGKFGGTVSAIYPVPATSVLNIRFAGTVDPVGRIRLVNMAGQYVLDQETSLQDHFVTLNVSMLAPGAYALEIKTANFSYVTKIIIER